MASKASMNNLSPEEELRELSHKYDELCDRMEFERLDHDQTRGYRQLAEQDRDHLKRLLGKIDLPEDLPSFAPDGYAVELNRVVQILLNSSNPTEGRTVSQVVAEILAKKTTE